MRLISSYKNYNETLIFSLQLLGHDRISFMRFTEEFEIVYIRYSDKIYRYLYFQTKDPYLSEDITAEVFLKAWKKWKTFKKDYVQALLFKIARNTLIDHWRKNNNRKESSLETKIEEGIEPFYDEDFIEKMQSDENVKNVNAALQLLPKNLKEVAILRFIEDMSAKEVGEILSISEGNVRVLQYRALIKLKEIFGK